MPLIVTADRAVASVTATLSQDWQVVSIPTGFQGITSANFADNDKVAGFVIFENGVDWEVYDTDEDDATKLLEIANISGTVTITRPATPYASSNSGARVTAGSGTHTLVVGMGAGTAKRLMRETNPTWKTFTSADATPDVSGFRLFKTNGTTPITAFDSMEAGKVFFVQRGNNDIVITNGAGISLPNGENITLTAAQPAAIFMEDSGVAVLAGTTGTAVLDEDDFATDSATRPPSQQSVGAYVAQVPNVSASTELTIATGAITPTLASHTVDTEADAASDDLDTITATNFSAGYVLTLAAANAARTVVVKHGTGNILLPNDEDISLDDTEKTVQLRYDGSNWNYVSGGGVDALPDYVPNVAASSTLTIGTGSITATRAVHIVAAESGTADDLDTVDMSAFPVGGECTIVADTGDTISVTSGVGTITTDTGSTITLDAVTKYCTLRKTASGVHASLGGGSGLGDTTIFSVVDYGAVGDGATADNTAVAAALSALTTAGGGTLYFPEGDYVLTAKLTATLYSALDNSQGGITIRGAGPMVTSIRLQSGNGFFEWDNRSDGLPARIRLIVKDLTIVLDNGGSTCGTIFTVKDRINNPGQGVRSVVFERVHSVQATTTDYCDVFFDGYGLKRPRFNDTLCSSKIASTGTGKHQGQIGIRACNSFGLDCSYTSMVGFDYCFDYSSEILLSAEGAMTATDATLTVSTATFADDHVGNKIMVKGAGTAGADHVTTIASINSSTSVELTAVAVTTVAAADVLLGNEAYVGDNEFGETPNNEGGTWNHCVADGFIGYLLDAVHQTGLDGEVGGQWSGNCHWNTVDTGIKIKNRRLVNIEGSLGYLTDEANGIDISLTQVQEAQIANNAFHFGTNSGGNKNIVIDADCEDVIVLGNMFNNSAGANPDITEVEIASGANNIVIVNNIHTATDGIVDNGGTSVFVGKPATANGSFGPALPITIADVTDTFAIVPGVRSYRMTANDDSIVSTITGGQEGDTILIRPNSGNIAVFHTGANTTDKINLVGNANITLAGVNAGIVLYKTGTSWKEVARFGVTEDLGPKINYGPSQPLTIATDAIDLSLLTVPTSNITVDQETGTSDNLDTISNGTDGDEIVIRPSDNNIVVRDNGTSGGNIYLDQSTATATVTLGGVHDAIKLLYHNGRWKEIANMGGARA